MGETVGDGLGDAVGVAVGAAVGTVVGAALGAAVGEGVGAAVGTATQPVEPSALAVHVAPSHSVQSGALYTAEYRPEEHGAQCRRSASLNALK